MRVSVNVRDTSLNTSNLNFQGYQKPQYETKLNLVALMDIFTILVFFLLLNSGDSSQIQNAEFVKLPDSSASAASHIEATVLIGAGEIWLNKEKIITIAEALKLNSKQITPLAEKLTEYANKRGELTSYEKANGLAVTIMGDKTVPFSLLERVMATCSSQNFRDISLAVNRVAANTIMNTSSLQSDSQNSTQTPVNTNREADTNKTGGGQ